MRISVVVVAILATACLEGRTTTGPAPESLAGVRVLRSVNGNPLPAKVGSVAAFDLHRRILIDSLILAEDGTARRWTVVSDSTGSDRSTSASVLTDSGTYVRDGNSVVIRFNRSEAPTTGFVDGTGITLPLPGCANVAGCSVGLLTFRFETP